MNTRRYAFLPRNMWASLPAPLRRSQVLGSLYEASDGVLEKLIPALCTYHLCVAQK